MAFMVGARHLFYGISMLDRYRGAGWRKPMLIYWLSDETFAVNFSNIDRTELTAISLPVTCGCRHSTVSTGLLVASWAICWGLPWRIDIEASTGIRLRRHGYVCGYLHGRLRASQGHASQFMAGCGCWSSLLLSFRSAAVHHPNDALHTGSIIRQLQAA